MNEVVTIFLLAVDKFMPDMHLKQLDFAYSACGPFAKTKKELKRFCRLEIQILFTKMSLIKPVFNMICLMVNQRPSKKNSIRQILKR